MTIRFVMEESSWAGAAEADSKALSDAIQQLLERLDVARERNEGVARHVDYYETALGDDVQLFSALFDPDRCPVQLDRDQAEQLRLTLDRINQFDDAELLQYDAEFAGSVRFSPGTAWAHACCSQRHHVALLPLPLGEVAHGRALVAVAGVPIEMFFVIEESQHVEFFRSVIALENAGETMFQHLSSSAFPALEWADNVWQGLGDFSRPYIQVRDELVRCLGALSDHGAACFHQNRSGDPRRLQQVLSARIGFETSDENGLTKRDRKSKRDRTRRHRGTGKVFWWHVKLQPHVDRIHFLYEPPLKALSSPEHGRIVVGLFKDHCVLPN